MKAKVVEARCFQSRGITVCLWQDYAGEWRSAVEGPAGFRSGMSDRRMSRWCDVALMLAAEANKGPDVHLSTRDSLRTIAEELIGCEAPIGKWPNASDRWTILPYWVVVTENEASAHLWDDQPIKNAWLLTRGDDVRLMSLMSGEALRLMRSRHARSGWRADLLQVLAWASLGQVDPGYEAELPPLLTPPPPVPPAARFDPEAMASELEAMAKRLRQFAKR